MNPNTNRGIRNLVYPVLIFLLFIVIGLYHQPYFPTTWLDEGFALQGAINLARSGQYAMQSSEGLRILDQPLIANGPGIVLPITAAFKLFGIGLFQARVVAVIFMALTAVLFFLLAKNLFGTAPAFLSLFLLISLPQEGFLLYGRQAIGNVPSLGYFLAGMVLWQVVERKKDWKYALAAGLFFGLSMVTKGQYLLLLPIFLLFVLIYRFVLKRSISLLLVIILTSLGCLAVWWIVQFILIGPQNFAAHLDSIRSSSQVTIFAFHFMRVPGNLWWLVRSGVIVVAGPGLIYYVVKELRNFQRDPIKAFLFVFTVVWFGWYAFVSVGWSRYAFDPTVIGGIFTGAMVVETINKLRKKDNILAVTNRLKLSIRIAGPTFLIAFFAIFIYGFAQQVEYSISEPDKSPQELAAYLSKNVPPGKTVESWEWEIDTLTDVNFHHPTNDWVDKFTSVVQFNEELAYPYHPLDFHPEFLINGPFSKQTGIYTSLLDAGCCTAVYSTGLYDVYKVNK